MKLRINNTTNAPIFVDDTDGKLGLSVQQQVGSDWFSFLDTGTCACLSCSSLCAATCACADGGTPFVRKIGAGEVDERTWDGVVQVSGTVQCSSGEEACLDPANAPGDETFKLHLCFQTMADGLDFSDGGRSLGELAPSPTCADKEFHPSDGVVEVGPFKGAMCTMAADCRGVGELCLAGSCTSGCPANGFPTVGAGWALRIPSPDDQGFFTTSMDGAGHPVMTGVGTITSVTYLGQAMHVNLTQADGGTGNSGTLYVDFPPGFAAPLVQDTHVSVKVIDESTTDNQDNRAVVISDLAGNLLFAADTATQGAILSNSDTAPFTVKWGSDIVGCAMTACGKELFVKADITGPMMESLLDPGTSADQTTAQGTYRLLNVGSGTYQTTACTLTDIRPYAVWFLHN